MYIPSIVKRKDMYKDGWIDLDKDGAKDPYEDPNLCIEERVDDLLSKMSFDEKLEQLRSSFKPSGRGFGNLSIVLRNLDVRESAEKANEIMREAIEDTRLGIPVIIHDECLHGCMAKYSTVFPQAIALAATWDPDLVYRVAKAIAREARSRGIRQCLSPVANLARDVRGGRTEETFGEDPYLASTLLFNYCKALREEGIIATPKHFIANFIGDGGRDSAEIHLSERILRETEFLPFYACIKAGALSIMAAYNSVDGIPCSANRWLLTEVLRWEWGFKGFVVSDYGSVAGVLYKHRTADKPEIVAKKALEAGLDVELPEAYIYGEPLNRAKDVIPLEVINEAVRRVLRAKFLIGLFDNPYVNPDDAEKIVGCQEHVDLALEAARKSIVLLKNEGVLPLDRNRVRKILIVGHTAKELKLGGYTGIPRKVVSPLEAITEKLSKTNAIVEYIMCCPQNLGTSYLAPYLIPPKGVEGHGVKIELFDNPKFEGLPVEQYVGMYWGGFRYEWGYGRPSEKIKNEQYSVRFSGRILPPLEGVYELCVGVSGGIAKLRIDGNEIASVYADGISTIKCIDIEFSKKEYDFVVEYIRTRGYASIRLTLDIKNSKDVEKAIESAKSADAVIIFVDIVEGEERDRAILRLSKCQEQLIERLLEVNKNVVVVIIAGSPVVGEWIYKVPAILMAWYPGQEGGRAIADVLFGDYNPAGRLPITWPHTEGQLPLYYNYKPSGRVYDYVDMTGAPLFPFGYGLSYTKFSYSNLSIDKSEWQISIRFDVENVGDRDGEEVVQLYIRDLVSSIARPVKELRRFKRVYIRKGEKKTITFTLYPEDFAYYDENMRRVVEPGEFEILIGSSSEDIRLRGIVNIDREIRSIPRILNVDVKMKDDGNAHIVAMVMNEGMISDLIPIKLLVDGNIVEEHRIFLEPSEKREVVFTRKLDRGMHRIEVLFDQHRVAKEIAI